MDIIVKGKNCDVPPRLKEEAVARLNHATRFYDRLLAVEMVFSQENNPRIPEPAVIEVTARTKGHLLRAEGTGEDHRGAIDVVMARFERQLRRYKARLVDRGRRSGRLAPSVNGLVPTESSSREGEESFPPVRIARTKRFPLTPLLPEDAALQCELLGHEFFLFSNTSTGRCSVVYRRRDGDFGLIEAAE